MAELDKTYEGERRTAENEAVMMRDEVESDGKVAEFDGKVNQYEKLQSCKRPEVDDSFLGAKIEQLWNFKEKDGT